MAGGINKPCSDQPCANAALPGGKCAVHRRAVDRRRGTTKQRGYGHDWEKLRAAKLAHDPVCEIRTHCNGAVANEVDHIIPIEKRPDLRLVWGNLQSACKPCHSAKTARENGFGETDQSDFAAITPGSSRYKDALGNALGTSEASAESDIQICF